MKRRGNSSAKDYPLRLERVLGMTSLHSSSITSNSKGDVFYSAGNMSVRYNSDDNRQKWFFSASSRAITCQSVSDDGRYLAVGERGHQPAVIVWDIERKEKVATLNAHKHGIGCLTFSPNGQYLVTVGFKHDRQLIVWEWMHLKIVAVLKLTNKVNAISFQSNGKYFVTCGDRHLKWWYFDVDDEGEATIVGKPASILEEHRNSVFMDICCGSGIHEEKVFCVTSTGILCCFLDSSRMMDKWIQLDSVSAYTVSLITYDELKSLYVLIAGCSDGIIRTFSPDDLNYISTFPLPCPLPSESDNPDDSQNQISFPACYGIRYIAPSSSSGSTSSHKLAAIYADRSLYIWNISDINNIAKHRSFESHRGCIWDIQFLDSSEETGQSPNPSTLPQGTFITCCSDNTIKFWNTDVQAQKKSKWRSAYSREVLHTLELFPQTDNIGSANSPTSKNSGLDSALSIDKSENSILSAGSSSLPTNARGIMDLSVGIPDYELPDKQHSSCAPRSLSINSYHGHLACGDRSGKLRVYDIRSMREILNIQAHSAEILTLNYSPPLKKSSTGVWAVDSSTYSDNSETPLVLLASAGRDRLMHIFDVSNNYSLINTLDNHSSSITTVKFTSDGQRVLSCGGDKTLVFCSVNGPEITRMKSVQTPHGTINGLALETTNKYAVTSGQDRRMNIYNVQSGKHMRAYKSDSITGELYKCDIDPSGTYVCACGFDKTIYLLDFFSGDVIAQVSGHSELITGCRFSQDGRYIISIGGDGCILMWRVGELLVKAMQDRLMELLSKAQRNETKAILRQSLSTVNSKLQQPTQPVTSPTDKSKWAARVPEGYELFGKMIIPGDRNRLTLELTQNSSPTPSIAPPGEIISLEQAGSHQLASTYEAQDNVILSGLSDDEDDESLLFQISSTVIKDDSLNDEKYEDDFDGAGDVDQGQGFNQSKSKLDLLEKSAQNLEDWLELKLRNDGKLDDTVSISLTVPFHGVPQVPAIIPEASQIKPEIYLGRSLSSKFFKELKQPPTEQATTPSAAQSAPPRPDGHALELKRRETAAAVANMKDRLRAMGILNATLPKKNEPPPDLSLPSPPTSTALPPPPPMNQESSSSISKAIASEDTASEDDEPNAPILSARRSVDMVAGSDHVAAVKLAADICRQSLRELDYAKEKAMKSLQEFIVLQERQQRDVASSISLGSANASLEETSSILKASISREAQQLLLEYQSSLQSMSVAISQSISHPLSQIALQSSDSTKFNPQQSYINTSVAGSTDSQEQVSNILEKYSDRLLELVSSKIAEKMVNK